MTNARGRYAQIQRLAPGTVFQLGSAPTDVNRQWRLDRIAGGVAYVERLHEDKTKRIQKANPALMVYAIPTEVWVFPDEVFPPDEETEDE